MEEISRNGTCHKRSSSPADDGPTQKLVRHSSECDVSAFVSWMKLKDFCLSEKVDLRVSGSASRIGLFARSSLEAGEELFRVPRHCLLSPETCRIAELLSTEKANLQSDCNWLPLLIALMYEVTTPPSPWQPYLELIPDFDVLDLPMYWDSSERERLLSGTGLVELVHKDLAKMSSDFKNIVQPFLSRHRDVFSAQCHSEALFRRLTGFVMSYSFTEPLQEQDSDSESEAGSQQTTVCPVMVPMADMLNHVAENNAQLDWRCDHLVMVTTSPVAPGEEIYNTYGELSNAELLHMYGFTEPPEENSYDTVKLPGSVIKSVASELSVNSPALLQSKWSWLAERGVLDESSALVVDASAVLTEDEASVALKILCQDAEDFDSFTQSDDWEEDDPVDLDYENGIQKLPADQKDFLKTVTTRLLHQLPSSQSEDERQLTSAASGRLRNVLQLRIGQRHILRLLTEALHR